MNKTSKAQREAIKKYDEKFDRIYTRLPKGTKARIEATEEKSINKFIVDAVEEKLKNQNPAYQECLESHLKALEEMDNMTE